MKKFLIPFLLLASVYNTKAQPLVFKNIDVPLALTGLEPFPLADINGRLLLTANTATEGTEVWATDGTLAGTAMLKDIYPGPSGGFAPMGSLMYNGKYYFAANDNTHGREIWMTDGTTTGTQLLLDINPGTKSAIYTSWLSVSNGKLFFLADDGTHGNELWISDGTAAGTTMLKDLYPGITSPKLFGANGVTELNGKTFFSAYTPAEGQEIWVTDGTTAGTQLLKDIYTGGDDSYPANFTKFKNELYFFARTADGYELWHTDGTTAGTTMLKDINPAGDGVYANCNMVVLNNKLYFIGIDATNGAELWSTDGTAAGTQLVKDIYPGATTSRIGWMYLFGNKLYFAAEQPGIGMEPWISDGTAAGTTILKELNAGANNSNPKGFLQYKNHVYFFALQNNNDQQLWQTDGTTANTKVVAPPGTTSINPIHSMCVMLYLSKDSSLYINANYNGTGTELWTIKDTSTNTTGISTQALPADVNIYPNPAHHNFTLKTTTAFTTGSVTLTDITGKVVMDKHPVTNTQTTISLTNIAPGIYMADIWLDDKRSTLKLVIE